MPVVAIHVARTRSARRNVSSGLLLTLIRWGLTALTRLYCGHKANGVGEKSRRSAAIEGGLAPGTAAEADAEAPSQAQAIDTADYWTPVQQEPAGEMRFHTPHPLPHLFVCVSGHARSDG